MWKIHKDPPPPPSSFSLSLSHSFSMFVYMRFHSNGDFRALSMIPSDREVVEKRKENPACFPGCDSRDENPAEFRLVPPYGIFLAQPWLKLQDISSGSMHALTHTSDVPAKFPPSLLPSFPFIFSRGVHQPVNHALVSFQYARALKY